MFRQEYPTSWEDALSGGGDFLFFPRVRSRGPRVLPRLPVTLAYEARAFTAGAKYVKAWDIGRHQDAAVGIVLDVTEDVHDVVHYVRLREQSLPDDPA